MSALSPETPLVWIKSSYCFRNLTLFVISFALPSRHWKRLSTSLNSLSELWQLAARPAP